MNKLVKTIKKDDLYSEFLKALNGITDLPNRELQLLTLLVRLQIEPQLSDNDPETGVLSANNRKFIEKELGITADNQSRYYKKFKDLGYLVKGKIDRQWLVNQILIPQVIKDRVQITIILRINEEENN